MKFEEYKIGNVVTLKKSGIIKQLMGDDSVRRIKTSSKYFIITNKNYRRQSIDMIPLDLSMVPFDSILPSCLRLATTEELLKEAKYEI